MFLFYSSFSPFYLSTFTLQLSLSLSLTFFYSLSLFSYLSLSLSLSLSYKPLLFQKKTQVPTESTNINLFHFIISNEKVTGQLYKKKNLLGLVKLMLRKKKSSDVQNKFVVKYFSDSFYVGQIAKKKKSITLQKLKLD